MSRAIAAGLLAGLATVTAAAVVLVGHNSPPSAQAGGTLVERINGACRPGYHVADWTTGDEFDPQPAGVVRVTCQGRDLTDNYTVAVSR